MLSSICIPTVLGSKATLTPEPKTPMDELPTQEFNRKKIKSVIKEDSPLLEKNKK